MVYDIYTHTFLYENHEVDENDVDMYIYKDIAVLADSEELCGIREATVA